MTPQDAVLAERTPRAPADQAERLPGPPSIRSRARLDGYTVMVLAITAGRAAAVRAPRATAALA